MKSVFAALVLSLTSTIAFAWPAVGDNATYDLMLNSGSQTIYAEMVITITDINESADTLTLSTQMNGQSVQEVEKYSEVLALAEGLPNMLENCSQMGGTPEMMTVPAGTWPTCKFVSTEGPTTDTTWLSDLLFGVVKSTSVDSQTGLKQEMVLRAFEMN